jgi:hypothetical protein
MPFRKYVFINGQRYEATSYGLLHRPQPKPGKRHRCRDCFVCQNCGEDRCRVCRARRGR